jgi:hypothetical protein
MNIRNIEAIEVIDEEMARVLRAKTGADRWRIASGMFAAARRMLLCSLAAEHPDWEPRQVIEETARRLSHGAG